ncbi:Alpha/Beta hydrolase protein [Schizophyllum commune]
MPLNSLTTKEFTTSRGVKYTYRHATPQADRPTLLLLHGFPSTPHDWRHQIAHFGAKGYGLIVPDMLGYGGTDKPGDPAEYIGAKQSRDFVDLVEHEKAERVIVVGHDWGTMPTAYLAVLHQHRFLGFVHLSVGLAIRRGFYLEEVLVAMKQKFGTELFGYWAFFNKDEAADIIDKNVDSLFDLLYPKDPALWKTHMTPVGAADVFLTEGRQHGAGDYVAEEHREIWRQAFTNNGLSGPLNWYKMASRGLQDSDGLDISPDTVKVQKPFLYIGGSKDYVCLPELHADDNLKKACEDLRVEVFDAGHWLQLELPDQVNETIEKWVEEKGLATIEAKA